MYCTWLGYNAFVLLFLCHTACIVFFAKSFISIYAGNGRPCHHQYGLLHPASSATQTHWPGTKTPACTIIKYGVHWYFIKCFIQAEEDDNQSIQSKSEQQKKNKKKTPFRKRSTQYNNLAGSKTNTLQASSILRAGTTELRLPARRVFVGARRTVTRAAPDCVFIRSRKHGRAKRMELACLTSSEKPLTVAPHFPWE